MSAAQIHLSGVSINSSNLPFLRLAQAIFIDTVEKEQARRPTLGSAVQVTITYFNRARQGKSLENSPQGSPHSDQPKATQKMCLHPQQQGHRSIGHVVPRPLATTRLSLQETDHCHVPTQHHAPISVLALVLAGDAFVAYQHRNATRPPPPPDPSAASRTYFLTLTAPAKP
ncbi:hypothetical protein BDU57DRAFT_529616 [Ampelomyces quisqualis]|uniref:Uncharacterized protein n=1 Tax=Ampelomyces quisqualis TaxID=50730 RepID=A0A6A5QML3_AMPQU|nr:hypothetical protein BDU57DRAFT_529616 [Ampelomyces quisqualis]